MEAPSFQRASHRHSRFAVGRDPTFPRRRNAGILEASGMQDRAIAMNPIADARETPHCSSASASWKSSGMLWIASSTARDRCC